MSVMFCSRTDGFCTFIARSLSSGGTDIELLAPELTSVLSIIRLVISLNPSFSFSRISLWCLSIFMEISCIIVSGFALEPTFSIENTNKTYSPKRNRAERTRCSDKLDKLDFVWGTTPAFTCMYVPREALPVRFFVFVAVTKIL